MTNGELLEQTIKDKGIKIAYICKELDISHKAFRNKLLGKTEFKGSEIYKLTKMLGLSLEERERIFFAS